MSLFAMRRDGDKNQKSGFKRLWRVKLRKITQPQVAHTCVPICAQRNCDGCSGSHPSRTLWAQHPERGVPMAWPQRHVSTGRFYGPAAATPFALLSERGGWCRPETCSGTSLLHLQRSVTQMLE